MTSMNVSENLFPHGSRWLRVDFYIPANETTKFQTLTVDGVGEFSKRESFTIRQISI